MVEPEQMSLVAVLFEVDARRLPGPFSAAPEYVQLTLS